MANQKITDLVQIETISSDDVLPIVDISDNITKKINITQIKAQSPVQSVNATTGDVTVQATLVSGTNIKTINSTSILGSGDLVVAAAPSGVSGSVQFSDGSALASDATNFFWDNANDRLGIGTASPNAALDVSSTTQGFLPPRMTTAQRDAIATPATGLVVYNTSTNSHNFYNGTAWKALAVASGVAGQVQFSDGTNLASTGNLFWRSDTNRLGINVTSVTNTFDVNGNAFIGNNINSGTSARLAIKGTGSTTATTNTQWLNSASGAIGALNDAGNVSFVGKGSFGNAGSGSILNVKGSGATSATSSILVQNSSSNQTFSVRDDGVVFVGLGGLAVGSAKFQVKDQSDNICISVAQSDILFGNSAVLRSNDGIMYPTGNITFRSGNPNSAVINFGDSEVNSVSAIGVFSFIKFTRNWTSVAPSLNLTINVQETQNVINMTNGTGTKIFRGIYHNPTVTAVTSHRAFESTSGGGHFNTTSVDASSVLQADSTTQGFLMPRMTTTQRDAIATPATGLSIYNTTTNSVNYYNGTAWEDTKLVVTNRQIASYTLAITDANKLVEMNVATANNLTIPLDSTVAYSIGTQILISQYGAGQTSVVATVGVTVRSSGGKLKLNAQYSGATLIKIATNEWYCFGDLSA